MQDLVFDLFSRLKPRAAMIATAESCTGGMIAAALTDVAGSSACFERGFITYTNASKTDLLGVPQDTLATFGAVSAQTADAMARGVLNASPAEFSLSVTGIAGPSGGSAEKPVGLVYIGTAMRGGACRVTKNIFTGDRAAIRRAAAEAALKQMTDFIP